MYIKPICVYVYTHTHTHYMVFLTFGTNNLSYYREEIFDSLGPVRPDSFLEDLSNPGALVPL